MRITVGRGLTWLTALNAKGFVREAFCSNSRTATDVDPKGMMERGTLGKFIVESAGDS
jgi:hypothetical protein